MGVVDAVRHAVGCGVEMLHEEVNATVNRQGVTVEPAEIVEDSIEIDSEIEVDDLEDDVW